MALGAGVSDGGLLVDVDVPQRHLATAADLVTQALADPVFPEAEVRRILRNRLAEIEQERASSAHRAVKELARTLWAPGERAALPTAGTPESIAALTRDDLVDFHARHVGPVGSTVVVAGDLGGVDVVGVLEATLGTWRAPRHEPATAAHGAPPGARPRPRRRRRPAGFGPDRDRRRRPRSRPLDPRRLGPAPGPLLRPRRVPERAPRRRAARGEGLHLRHPLGLPAPGRRRHVRHLGLGARRRSPARPSRSSSASSTAPATGSPTPSCARASTTSRRPPPVATPRPTPSPTRPRRSPSRDCPSTSRPAPCATSPTSARADLDAAYAPGRDGGVDRRPRRRRRHGRPGARGPGVRAGVHRCPLTPAPPDPPRPRARSSWPRRSGRLELVERDGALVAHPLRRPRRRLARARADRVAAPRRGPPPAGRVLRRARCGSSTCRCAPPAPTSSGGCGTSSRAVPWGTTTTYGWIADRLGLPPGASRAVGAANGANPLPIVLPCHRVVGADGTLTGYAGGLERKADLLRLEGVPTEADQIALF